jgi:hypothetical protein
LHGQVNNHAHLAASQFVAFEAAVRMATAAAIAIAHSVGDCLLMPIQGGQD